MKLISIGDGKGKNAMVGIAPFFQKPEKVEDEKNISHRIIKTTLKTHISTLQEQAQNDTELLFKNLIEGDPEIDLKEEGRFIEKLHYIYVNNKNELVSDVRFEEQIFNADGLLKEQRPFNATEANIQSESLPIRWTGITMPVYEAVRRYIFSQTYQLFHINGLTYSFLYNMAKELYQKQVVMFVGGGSKGSDPIVLRKGGKKYRGFMSGDIFLKGYKLLIHLTDIDLEDY